MPRGLGSFVAMFFVGRLVGKVDTRIILAVGITLSAFSTWQMEHFALNMSYWPIVISGLFQGVGTGLIFVPLSAIAFATLDPKFRGEAAAVYTLIRNLGASAGISILEYLFTRNVEVVRSTLTPFATPDNPNAHAYMASSFSSPAGMAALSGEINRQAAMVSYIDVFHVMFMMSFFILPLLLLMQGRKRNAQGPASAPDLEAQGAH
jgi:DHA2 family multidrug resistance protein